MESPPQSSDSEENVIQETPSSLNLFLESDESDSDENIIQDTPTSSTLEFSFYCVLLPIVVLVC